MAADTLLVPEPTTLRAAERLVEDDALADLPGYKNYLVFCDESGMHGSTYYGFGSFWIPSEARGRLHNAVRSLRAARRLAPDEIKWSKINRGNKDFYCDLVKTFFERQWMMFHCLVVKKADVKLELHGGDIDLARRKHFTMFLQKKIGFFARAAPDKAYHVRVDPLLRCGKCGATMTHSTGTSANGDSYFYYKCSRRARTANHGCDSQQLRASAVETFVLDKLRGYTLDAEAIRRGVAQANAGKDQRAQKLDEELAGRRSALLNLSKVISKLVDVVEQQGDGLDAVLARLRERQAAEKALRDEIAALTAERQMLGQEILESEAVAESYAKMAVLLDEALQQDARAELQHLLRTMIETVEWRPDPLDPKRGEAPFELRPFPTALLKPVPVGGGGGAGELNARRTSSPSRQERCPQRDSNTRPAV